MNRLKNSVPLFRVFRSAITVFTAATAFAQHSEPMNSADLILALKKLNVTGSVLYIAAHPDDENTALLACLAKGRMVRTGYLSITRGSGGQNLIGHEIDNDLSILRTQELLGARKVDGAEQFFTRAVDFGYSKSVRESLMKWDREKILADMVWVIRSFRPDVIISRFSPEQGGHGHHLASAVLAEEAFYAASDSKKYPEQLQTVKPWQAKRLVWNGWNLEKTRQDSAGNMILKVDVGEYNSLLGKSFLEIAARARSMHKSQGFGSAAVHGLYFNYFQHMAGLPARADLFDDIDLSWKRVRNSAAIEKIILELEVKFNPADPGKSIPDLIALYKLFRTLSDDPIVQYKMKELEQIIQSCAGLWMEAIAGDYTVCPGDTLAFTCTLISRSSCPVSVNTISLPAAVQDSSLNFPLKYNEPFSIKFNLKIPPASDIFYPFWLRGYRGEDIYPATDLHLTGLPVEDPPLQVVFTLSMNDFPMEYKVPVYYRWADRVRGEKYRQVVITPPVTANITQPVLLFPNGKPRNISIQLKNWQKGAGGMVRLDLPEGWTCDPDSTIFKFGDKQEEQEVHFNIRPGQVISSGTMQIRLQFPDFYYSNEYRTVEYDHLPYQLYFPPTDIRLVSVSIESGKERIGYIMGSGDEIPGCLEQLGYQVKLITDTELQQGDFSAYDVVITGTRAYNSRAILQTVKNRLMEFVWNGGTLITLHNTRFGLRADNIGPYPLKISDDRVSAEEAPVEFLLPAHPLLKRPNLITSQDFDNWIQERGLYFAGEWDDRYQPVLGCNDPGEKLKPGGLLYTNYGKGHFIYSGYSWFRQLPAGVPGALRLFVNMISIREDADGKSPH